ncbi:flavodoxin domain-containing protein [Streptomyces sp. ODS28]|uniref:flavodoxin domain-containing protein n=1 Tax=Streptomyces sp. ODS28 TaxID=3136688 RepID=UPI0031F08E41
MPPQVLVAYGSTNGSTAQIAEWIADALKAEGCAVQVRSAAERPSPESYDAVVVGGALYSGHWHRDARRFARRYKKQLARRPVWLFSSGPLDSSAEERELPPVPEAKRALMRVDAREHLVFGGKLDDTAQGWLARRIVAAGRGGDFRDRERIQKWARGIGRELDAEFGDTRSAQPY